MLQIWKKVVLEILSDSLTYKLLCGFITSKVSYNSNKILPMKFYSSSLERSILQTHIIVYRFDCCSKISIRTFFQIWIWSTQIDFIVIFRFERFHTKYSVGTLFTRNYTWYIYRIEPSLAQNQHQLDNECHVTKLYCTHTIVKSYC